MSSKPNFFSWSFSWRAILRALAMILIVLPIIAEDGAGGGDGGIINLPGVRDKNTKGLVGWRLRVAREDFHPGIVLHLPEELRSSVVIMQAGEDMVPLLVTDGYIVLSGESLDALRAAQVFTLTIEVRNLRNEVLSMTLALDDKGFGYTLTVW